MESVNIREARQRLREIVDAAERGESVLITRHGRQVAQIGPIEPARSGGLPDLTEFRKALRIGGKALSRIVIDGRRQARF